MPRMTRAQLDAHNAGKLAARKPKPPLETQIVQAIERRLLYAGWQVLRVHGTGMYDAKRRYIPSYRVNGRQASGVPDLICFRANCPPGGAYCEAVFLEVKRPNTGKHSPAQKAFRELWESRGMTVHTVTSVTDLDKIEQLVT